MDVQAQDVDGSTALHYLAGTLNANEKTVLMLRGFEGGEEVWQNARNWYDVTPLGIWENKRFLERLI